MVKKMSLYNKVDYILNCCFIYPSKRIYPFMTIGIMFLSLGALIFASEVLKEGYYLYI